MQSSLSTISAQPKTNSKEAFELLRSQAEEIVSKLGYEVVALEQSQTPDGRSIILFIDFLENATLATPVKGVSLEDCLTVNSAVDELFETTTLIDGTFSLEVSSPGVERPLRKPQDFIRFRGRKARLHTFRSLDATEVENEVHWNKNQKQKNFIGTLEGMTENNKVKMMIDGQLVCVALDLISKANLEFEDTNEKKPGKKKGR